MADMATSNVATLIFDPTGLTLLYDGYAVRVGTACPATCQVHPEAQSGALRLRL